MNSRDKENLNPRIHVKIFPKIDVGTMIQNNTHQTALTRKSDLYQMLNSNVVPIQVDTEAIQVWMTALSAEHEVKVFKRFKNNDGDPVRIPGEEYDCTKVFPSADLSLYDTLTAIKPLIPDLDPISQARIEARIHRNLEIGEGVRLDALSGAVPAETLGEPRKRPYEAHRYKETVFGEDTANATRHAFESLAKGCFFKNQHEETIAVETVWKPSIYKNHDKISEAVAGPQTPPVLHSTDTEKKMIDRCFVQFPQSIRHKMYVLKRTDSQVNTKCHVKFSQRHCIGYFPSLWYDALFYITRKLQTVTNGVDPEEFDDTEDFYTDHLKYVPHAFDYFKVKNEFPDVTEFTMDHIKNIERYFIKQNMPSSDIFVDFDKKKMTEQFKDFANGLQIQEKTTPFIHVMKHLQDFAVSKVWFKCGVCTTCMDGFEDDCLNVWDLDSNEKEFTVDHRISRINGKITHDEPTLARKTFGMYIDMLEEFGKTINEKRQDQRHLYNSKQHLLDQIKTELQNSPEKKEIKIFRPATVNVEAKALFDVRKDVTELHYGNDALFSTAAAVWDGSKLFSKIREATHNAFSVEHHPITNYILHILEPLVITVTGPRHNHLPTPCHVDHWYSITPEFSLALAKAINAFYTVKIGADGARIFKNIIYSRQTDRPIEHVQLTAALLCACHRTVVRLTPQTSAIASASKVEKEGLIALQQEALVAFIKHVC